MAAYVYEFLWRGRINGDVAYHVILADEVDAIGGRTHVESGPLTPEQAEAKGFPLTAIVAEINATTLIDRDRALSDKATAETDRDRALAEAETVARENEELRAALIAREAEERRPIAPVEISKNQPAPIDTN